MSDFGIKISRDGFDVKDADIVNQIFNSEKNTLKIVGSGYVSATGSDPYGAFAMASVPHNLDFIPAYLAWVTANTVNYFKPTTDDDVDWGAYVYTTNTDLEVQFFSNVTRTITVFYILFADPGN